MPCLCFKWDCLNICAGGVFEKLLPEADYFSEALYTFDIGQNDLTAGYKLNMTTEQVKAYVPDVLSQLSNIIKVNTNDLKEHVEF